MRIVPRRVVKHHVLGNQNLTADLIVFGKKFLVHHHETCLTDCRTRLLLIDSFRTRIKTERCPPYHDRSRCYKDDAMTAVSEICEFPDQDLKFN